MVRGIFSEGYPPDKKDSRGYTLLHVGCSWNLERVVVTLKEYGACLELSDPASHTPLHEAAYRSNLLAAHILLTCGSSVNSRDRTNVTPLLLAAADGNAAIVKLLVKIGADIYAKTSSGQSALKIAANNGHTEIANFLTSAWKARNGGTPLHEIAIFSDPDKVNARTVCNMRVDVNALDKRGYTALHYAARHYSYENVEQMSAVAEVDEGGNHGCEGRYWKGDQRGRRGKV